MAVIRNIILDWSGTLVDDFGPVFETVNTILGHYGKAPFTEEAFREHFKLPVSEFYTEQLPDVPYSKDEFYRQATEQLAHAKLTVLPHAREFLDWAKAAGYPLFLLSAISQENYENGIRDLKLSGYFNDIRVQESDKRQGILELLAAHNLEPSETIFIGDMRHDLDAAKHAGVVSCGVLTGYDSLTKLKASNPDLIFRHLADVRGHLERHQTESTIAPPIATVGALIFNDKGNVLMVQTHKWSDKWGIPGGKIRGNEPSVEALRRETREETGLALRDIRFQLVQDCIEPPEFYRKAHFLLLNYTAQVDGSEAVTLNDEAQAHRWVDLDTALAMDLNGPTRLLIDHVRHHQHQPA